MKQSCASWEPFAALEPEQREKLAAYQRLLLRFNQKVNLISREDERHIERHLRHVLALSWRDFPEGSRVVDWGTGGGLPAIPLAICFPAVQVHAVDAVGKKVHVVRLIARRLGLENLYVWHGRAEDWPGRAHYSVSRATAPLEQLWRWHVCLSEGGEPAEEGCWRPGLLCLKGGDLRAEIADLEDAFPQASVDRHALRQLLNHRFFAEKYLVEVH